MSRRAGAAAGRSGRFQPRPGVPHAVALKRWIVGISCPETRGSPRYLSGSVEDRGQERARGLVVETDTHERHRLDHA
jgi:hypothetical protein